MQINKLIEKSFLNKYNFVIKSKTKSEEKTLLFHHYSLDYTYHKQPNAQLHFYMSNYLIEVY